MSRLHLILLVSALTLGSAAVPATLWPSAAQVAAPDLHALAAELLSAADYGDLRRASTILAAGADIDYPRGGYTPLMVAVLSGRTEMVRFLLSRGARTDLPDEDGRTPLDWALKQGKTEIAQLLRVAMGLPATQPAVQPAASAPPVAAPPRAQPVAPAPAAPKPGARPQPGAYSGELTGNYKGNRISFRVSPDGTRIVDVRMTGYWRCAESGSIYKTLTQPVSTYGMMPGVVAVKSGTFDQVARAPYLRWEFRGRFASAVVIEGTFQVMASDCDSYAQPFRVTRTGP